MSELYNCVNCNCFFTSDAQYKEHYKSQHHRYNVKRRLINLIPLSLEDYINQFQSDLTSKTNTEKQLYCQICSKKFLSINTYKHHMNSKKHKKCRKNIVEISDSKSQNSHTSSEFSILGLQKPKKCMFCNDRLNSTHLKQKHCFPPFQTQCIDIEELSKYVSQKIVSGQCAYCNIKFGCQDSVKQHMMDVGHAKLNIDDFYQFEKFYLWKIAEESSEEQAELLVQNGQNLKSNENVNVNQSDQQSFEDLGHPTLDQLQKKRLQRIKFTAIGPVINGKQFGFRYLKRYFKQYLGRDYPEVRLQQQRQLQAGSAGDWQGVKNNKTCSTIEKHRGALRAMNCR